MLQRILHLKELIWAISRQMCIYRQKINYHVSQCFQINTIIIILKKISLLEFISLTFLIKPRAFLYQISVLRAHLLYCKYEYWEYETLENFA